MNTQIEKYQEIFEGAQESLDIFLRNMRKFDENFCELMNSGVDFTLKLEVHGNKGKLVHSRVLNDSWDRPKGSNGKVEKKKP